MMLSLNAQYREVKHFTMADGLPTNSIYNCVEDQHGFLWIATDQGVMRFDGKQFQQFTTEQGLPDNEVLKVLKEKNGKIWIHSFKQTPAYFDEIKNRFINSNEDSLLKHVSSKRLLFCYNTIGDGMEFYSESGTSLFSNHHKYEYNAWFQNNFGLVIQRINAENCISIVMNFNTKRLMLYHVYQNAINEQKDLGVTGGSIFFNNIFIHQDKVYCLVSQKENSNIHQFVCLSDIKTNPLTFHIDTMCIQKTLSQISITNHFIIVSYNAENRFEIYDVNTKERVQTIQTTYAVNSVSEDTNGDLWVCTVDKGLIKFKQTLIQKKDIAAGLNDMPYLSISGHQGSLFMGTTTNQIIESTNGVSVIHDLPANSDLYGWQRDILFSGNKICSFSDAGSYMNYRQPLLDPGTNSAINAKAAMLLNDSMILCGTHARFYRINTHTEKVEVLNNQDIRITSMVTYNDSLIYYGSTDGLHKYDVVKKENIVFDKTNPLLHERVVSLCKDSDSIVWVATAGNGILAVLHDSVISHISLRQGLNTSSIRTIATGQSKQLFVGTNEGISILDYSSSIRNPSIKNISVNDGLSSNVINRILYQHDSVYVATNSGVSIFPASLSIPTFDIPVKLIGVQINQQDTCLLTHYSLAAKQYNISLHFAGIELNGHFRNAQLSLNQGETWADIEGNEINLQLANGAHPVWLRSVDVNRNISQQMLKLQFDIATPFYKTWWFLVMLTGLMTGLMFWFYNRRKIRIQKQLLDQQLALETQRNKITADLHDDIGSTLSSLQVNSNVANQLLDKDQTRVREVLKKIEMQSQNLSDKIGDFIWSMKLGEDEFMSMSHRIKTFVSDILGSTEIHYEMNIDEEINTRIKDFSIRKNIVLIVKEAVNNAAKYSRANNVWITIKLEEELISLSVADDGKGMLTEDNMHKGNGLSNMQKRAEELHGEFEIMSTPDHGTKIRVTFRIPE